MPISSIHPGIAIAIATVAALAIKATLSRGSSVIDSKPSRIIELSSHLSVEEVFKKLVRFAQNGTFKTEAVDEEKKVIVFGENMNLTSNGFFYPIYLSEDNGSTKIEVGIKCKSIQIGPVVTAKHEAFVESIKIAIMDV